jgi:hypothetical protein
MNTGVLYKHCLIPFMRNASRGGSPGNTGAPKGMPEQEKENTRWQLD